MREYLKELPMSVLAKQLLEDQKELNAAYNPDWESVSADSYQMSAVHEFAGEFMKEIEGKWSFFGNKPVNVEAAIFELTDFWFHYASRVLAAEEKAPRCPSYVIRNLQRLGDLDVKDQTDVYCMALSSFIEEITKPLATDPVFTLECIRLIMNNVLEQPFELFVEAYELKRERNFHRAKNGALDGTYDKSNETELKLELS